MSIYIETRLDQQRDTEMDKQKYRDKPFHVRDHAVLFHEIFEN